MARVRTIIVLLSAIVTMLASAQAAAPEHVPVAHVSSGSEQDIWGFTYAYNQCTYKALEITGKTITQTQWQVCECDNLSAPCPKNNSICTSNILGDWPGSPDYEVLINDAHTLRVKLWGADQLSPAPDCFSWALATTSYTDTTTPSTPPLAASSEDCPMYEWFTDSDNDGHYAKIGSCESPGAGYTKDKSAFVAYDCDDNDASVTAPVQWCEDHDGDKWHGKCHPVCESFTAYPLKQSLSKGEDCNDSDAQAQEIKQYVVDQDQDGYIVGFAVDSCDPPSANYTELVTTVLGSDCDDDDASVKGKRMYCHDNDGDTFWSGACQPKCHPTGDYQAVKYAHKKDCDDNDPTKRIVQPFYFDADQDGYPDESSKISECADELNNNIGAWKSYYAWKLEPTQTGTDIIFDECDDDPHGHKLSLYFRDHDGDGIPYKNEDNLTILTQADIPAQQSMLPQNPMSANIPNDPVFASGPGLLLAPQVQHDRPRTNRLHPNDQVNNPTIPRTHSTSTAGLDPALLLHEERQYCSDQAAAAEGFAPPPDNDMWDVCDHDPNNITPTLYCFDGDGDHYTEPNHSASGHYCSDTPPADGFDIACNDCDDNDPTTTDHWIVFLNSDQDAFGNVWAPLTIECSATAASLEEYRAGTYQHIDGGISYIANGSDLAEYLPSTTMLDNLRHSPMRTFHLQDTSSGYSMICQYNGSGIECIEQSIFLELRQNDLALDADGNIQIPRIEADAIPAEITMQPFSRSALFALLDVTILNENSWRYLVTNDGEALIYFPHDPLGPSIFAVKGIDYIVGESETKVTEIVAHILKYTPALSPAASALIEPYIIRRLIDFPHPFPVGILSAENNATTVKRRIVAGMCLGPERTLTLTQREAGLSPKDGHLLAKPWLYTESDVSQSLSTGLTLCPDTDLDYLPDPYEVSIGTNPHAIDSDGDGQTDGTEHRFGGYFTDLPHVKDEQVKIIHPASLKPAYGSDYDLVDSAGLAEAKVRAQKLLGPVIQYGMELYKDDAEIVFGTNDKLYLSLIEFANPGYWMSPWYRTELHHPNLNTSLQPLAGMFMVASPAQFMGLSGGCGSDGDEVCLNYASPHLNNNDMPQLINTLLHEALHHVISVSVPDPTGEIEHQAIYRILGISLTTFPLH